MVVKSIHNHVNLSEDEIRDWFSLTPVNEDYEIHEKRLNKILTEYLGTKVFPTNNAKSCYKRQLKEMIKTGKINTPKYKEFNQWRNRQILFHINKQKDWLLENAGQKMPKHRPKDVSTENKEIEYLKQSCASLKSQVEILKKQLAEKNKIIKEKDEQIELLSKHEVKEEEVIEEVKEEEVIEEVKEEEVIEEVKEEEVKEEVKNNPIVIHFDTESEEEEEDSDEETKIPYNHAEFYKIRNVFYDICNKKAIEYFEKYNIESKNMNDIEKKKFKYKLINEFVYKIVEKELDKIDNRFEIPENVYSDMFQGGQEKIHDKF